MTEINELAISLDCGTIRVTPDGKRVSAYDVIQASTGVKNPWRTWSEIEKKYPDVLRKASDFLFSGQGQKSTPVVDLEGFVLLTMVLPGEGGATFRLRYKDIVIAWMEGRLGQGRTAQARACFAEADRITYEAVPGMLEGLAEKAKGGNVGAVRAFCGLIEMLRRGSLLTPLLGPTQLTVWDGESRWRYRPAQPQEVPHD